MELQGEGLAWLIWA